MKMKIIDKYLIKQFVLTILFALLTFFSLFLVIDLMENLDDFVDHDVPFDIIIRYYGVFIPEIFRLMIPVSVLLACLFTVGRMSTQNEITALKSSGISLYRYMLPFLAVGLFISIFAIYFGGYLVPIANKDKEYLGQTYLKKGIEYSSDRILFQDSNTRIISINYYDVVSNNANKITILDFNPENMEQMIFRIDADRMQYDTLNKEWVVYNGVRRSFENDDEAFYSFQTMRLSSLNFTPKDVIKKQRKPIEMTLSELSDYADEQLFAGNDPTRILIEYNSKISFAFASVIILLFALPISANRRKGGMAIQFGISVMIAFIYLAVSKMSESFGKNGVLDPMLTAWLPNIIFFIGGVINILRAEK
ncbi:MAG: LptF/LptG family permease [Ignavibacteriales bacterium]|nr:LptF/LptG family permease [Ignavibacteriales bacterium]